LSWSGLLTADENTSSPWLPGSWSLASDAKPLTRKGIEETGVRARGWLDPDQVIQLAEKRLNQKRSLGKLSLE
jgi:hypothetical protein